MSEAVQEETFWAPWHPKHGFQDEFMSATWVSTDLDEIAQRKGPETSKPRAEG